MESSSSCAPNRRQRNLFILLRQCNFILQVSKAHTSFAQLSRGLKGYTSIRTAAGQVPNGTEGQLPVPGGVLPQYWGYPCQKVLRHLK